MIEHLNKDDILIERYEDGRIHKPKPTKIEEHMADVTAGMNNRIGWSIIKAVRFRFSLKWNLSLSAK